MLALVVELLVTSLTGAHIGSEASTFFVDDGNRPRIGQVFLVIDPGGLAGHDVYDERIEALIAEMLLDEGVRLAGERRLALERKAREEGIELPPGL
jgi:(2R)-3-sulfolactate dehydrogenase (NADP+)